MKKEIIIGLVTIITIAASIWGYKYLLGSNILQKNYSFYTIFSDVKDIEVASEVLVNGYKVGTVTDITLSPDNVNKIRVDFEVSNEIKLPKTTKAVVKNDGVMGGRFIDLEFERMCQGKGDCAEDGSLIQGVVVGFLGSLVDPSEFGDYTGVITDKMGMGSDSSSTVNPTKTFESLDAAIANLEVITAQVGQLIAQSNASLEASFRNLAAITGNVASNDDKINAIIANLEKTSRQIADLNLSATVSKTNATVDATQQTISELTGTIAEAKTSIAKLQGVIDGVNDQSGTLGKLIHDNSLYTNLDETSNQLNLLLQDLRLNPKRYVNVSVFGKKDKEYVLPEDDPASRN